MILDEIEFAFKEGSSGAGGHIRARLEFNVIRLLPMQEITEMRLSEATEKELQIELAVQLLDHIQAELDAFRETAVTSGGKKTSAIILPH